MLYCEKCKSLINSNICRLCGTKKVREPKENDAVYLVTRNYLFSKMLEDVLAKNNIPYLISRQGLCGTAPAKAPSGTDEYKFFVPFGAYEKSKELLEDFFGED